MDLKTTTQIGREGESAALAYAIQQGMSLIERNWRGGGGEIDLILNAGDTIVFVEVKARKSTLFGTPAEFVSARKRRLLIGAATAYLAQYGLLDAPARFDVAEVYRANGQVRWIENAFST